MIVHKILSGNQENTAILRRISTKAILARYAAAAALVIIIAGAAGLFFTRKDTITKATIREVEGYDQKVINSEDKAMMVQLEDRSRVTLQPGAVLYYRRSSNTGNREVRLKGEAFFDITRDARRPFIVYHENLMTRVLGTSFYIRYNKQLKEVEVEVSTGKVEVSEVANDSGTTKRNNGVIVTPNQKVLYAEDKRLFSTVLADEPLPIIPPSSIKEGYIAKNVYEFSAAPMSVITEQLEKEYGIEIQMENEDLKNCLFSGDISDQRLYTKLDIICKAIGISYELKGTQILIKGKGCK